MNTVDMIKALIMYIEKTLSDRNFAASDSFYRIYKLSVNDGSKFDNKTLKRLKICMKIINKEAA